VAPGGAEPPAQDQGFRSGLSAATVSRSFDTVTNGVPDHPVVEAAMLRLFTVHLVDRALPPANTQNSGVGSGARPRRRSMSLGRPLWPGPIGLEAGGRRAP